MPNKVIEFFKEKLQDIKDERRKTSIAKAVAFAKQNKSCLIMLMDIKTDDMVAAYKDKYVAARMATKYLKRRTGLVKTILLSRGNTPARKFKKEQDISRFKEFVAEFLWQVTEKLDERSGDKDKELTKK